MEKVQNITDADYFRVHFPNKNTSIDYRRKDIRGDTLILETFDRIETPEGRKHITKEVPIDVFLAEIEEGRVEAFNDALALLYE